MSHSSFELGLVGGIISQYDGWETAIESIRPEWLSNIEAKEIFVAIQSLYAKKTTIDTSAVVYALGGFGTHWPNTISDALYGSSADSPMTCTRIVRQHAMHRELSKLACGLAAVSQDDDVDTVSDRIQAMQATINGFATGSGYVWDIGANSASIARFAKTTLDAGYRSGIESLDAHYRSARGLMTVVTGAPSSGKSEFLDFLLCCYAQMHKHRFCIFSPENYPKENHALKLIDKMFGKNKERKTHRDMDDEYLQKAAQKVGMHFSLIDLQDGDSCLDALINTLDKNWDLIQPDGFVIDPWNELEAKLRPGERETDYIGRCLARLRRWARKRDIMLWVVAHPTKMKKDDDGNYEVPTPYDISGSANWYNKADNAITVYRKNNSRFVDIHIQKIKQKIHGSKGLVELVYDNKTGIYYGKDQCPVDIMNEAKTHDAQEMF